MYRASALFLVAVILCPAVGCEWMKNIGEKKITQKDGGPLAKVAPDQLVTYLNDRAARLQSLSYGEARVVARDNSRAIPLSLPALRGYVDASQPRNFRMTATGTVGGKVDLGSNQDQFWVYVDAPSSNPLFVFASHSDFESGKAKIPGGIPFEPDWVMQALGMATFPPNNQYTARADDKTRTYHLTWPSTTPNGVAIVKEVVFDGDAATGNRPQVKKHIVRNAKGKVICSAEIKTAQTVQTGERDAKNQPLAVQYPTQLVLRWEEQKFEMDLELKSAQPNKGFTEEASRRLFSRPTIPGTTPIDLAKYEVPLK
ncbi:MAG: hypothetical protein L0241_05820 [Planctomycetia bacterium]|nr:hypothetical protein [Planctomycetia bacterium]